MKKSTIIVIVVIVLIAIWGITSYNGMVKMDESVSTAWSNVENQYQRRSDLIPNLVNTVKGYASHEKETFQAVELKLADRKSTRLNSSHRHTSRMPSSA